MRWTGQHFHRVLRRPCLSQYMRLSKPLWITASTGKAVYWLDKLETLQRFTIERLLVANGRLFVLARILLVSHFDRHRFCYYRKRSELQLHEAGEQFKHCLLDLYNGCVVVPK